MTASHGSEHQSGSMDISQHKKTYLGFLIFTKYSAIFIAIVMILLAIFRTHG